MRRTWLPALVTGLALAAAGCSDGLGSDPPNSLSELTPLFGHTSGIEPGCELVDFGQFAHGDGITTLSLFGGEVVLTVTAQRNDPSGAVSATAYDTELWDYAATPPPNNTHDDTQKNILCDDAANGGKGTCSGIMAVVPDPNFADKGDDSQGGSITFSGFSSDFGWQIPSFTAVDDDGSQTISLYVGTAGTFVGASSGLGNASAETVLTTDHAFVDEATFTLGGSGGIDNIEICRLSEGVGRMTGGGTIRLEGLANGSPVDVRITHGFTLHCDVLLSNNLEINWGNQKWHIEKESLKNVECTDEPDVAPEPPPAPFDTFHANGWGRLNGTWGSYIEFTLQDAGEPGGKNDKAGIKIWAVDADPGTDTPVLEVPFGYTEGGNLQAHYDQPHGSNVNK